ncbi:MAG: choice-of-anchor B family protein [Bacteroidia bacterium]
MKNYFLLLFLVLFSVSKSQNVNVVHRSNFQYPGKECANICGYVDSTGKEYALVGVETGMSIVDVTDPDNPFEVIALPWVAGPNQIWKEIKVLGHYAYVTSEAGGGLQIADLRHLPAANVPYHYWTPNLPGGTLRTIHALHIDTTKANLYLYGTNIGNGGAICCSLADPWNPVYLGSYDLKYVHDGYVDNDTLYAGEILDGTCTILDFTNKTNPQILSSFATPLNFTHNTWPSAGKRYLFTTDEKSNSALTSYDISDLGNVIELDQIKSNPGSNSIVHNTHITLDTFAVTSWYKDGFTIVDVKRPHNMVQVGNYDTYTAGAGNGFNGAWGVYPFLPSGTIVVSNIENGLHVLTPTYMRACWLEGNIKDSVTLVNLNGVTITIIGFTAMNTSTANGGNFSTGTVAAGSYNVQLSKTGYQTLVVNNVQLTNGVLSILNRKLLPIGVGINSYSNNQTSLIIKNNPFNEELKIAYALKNEELNATLIVTDHLGKVVETYNFNENSGEMSIGKQLSSGIYFVSLNNRNPIKVIKY